MKGPKGTLPSQLVINPRNSSQAHMAEEDPMNQCNDVHTLRSGKEVDNKVSMAPNPFSTTTHKHPLHLVPIHPNLTSLKRQVSQSGAQAYSIIS